MLYLEEYLDERIKNASKVAILGAGSVLKADDAAGMLLIEKLGKLLGEDYPQVLLVGGSTAPENFTGLIKSFAPQHLFLVDAALIEEEPGAIGVIDPEQIKAVSFSTHMLPFPIVVDYLQQHTGCQVSIIGIQPKSTRMEDNLCDEVEASVDELVNVFGQLFRKHYGKA